jgi:hypothetical protein
VKEVEHGGLEFFGVNGVELVGLELFGGVEEDVGVLLE